MTVEWQLLAILLYLDHARKEVKAPGTKHQSLSLVMARDKVIVNARALSDVPASGQLPCGAFPHILSTTIYDFALQSQ